MGGRTAEPEPPNRENFHDSVRAFYDRSAEAYDERWRDSRALDESIQRFCRALPAGSTIVDAGCGTGRDGAAFARRGLRTIGVDLSSSMLKLARNKGLGELAQSDILMLPFAESTFDGCWAAASLLHMPKAQLPVALTEIHRVLRPGGVLFACVKEGTGEGILEEDGDGRYRSLYLDAEIDHLLSSAGFRGLKAWTTTDTHGREPWVNRIAQRS